MARAHRSNVRWRTVGMLFLVALLVLISSGCATSFTPAFQDIPVASTPQGAEVWIDGEFVGVTPVTVNVKANEPHEVMVRLGDKVSYWTLERKVGVAGGLGLAADLLFAVPVVAVGGATVITGAQPCSPCSGFFCNLICEDPGIVVVGIGIAAVGLSPIIVDAATNQLYELVPKEITVEFE